NMLITKLLAPLAFVAAASAAMENLCFRDGKAIMSTGMSYGSCIDGISKSSVLNNWAGGKSTWCNGGTWELYWKVTGVDYARVCYGRLGSCTKYVAKKNDYIAGKIGAEKCWTATIP
ncbi:hypothetical protein DFQ26_008409, partial [Actinomortierella ambigua]